MGLIIWIVVGALTGWSVNMLTRWPKGWLGSIIVGIVAACITGLFVNSAISTLSLAGGIFSILDIITTLISASIFSFFFNIISGSIFDKAEHISNSIPQDIAKEIIGSQAPKIVGSVTSPTPVKIEQPNKSNSEEVKEIQAIINTYKRRLRVLQQQEALQGISVDPKVTLEIEDIGARISKLSQELKELQ